MKPLFRSLLGVSLALNAAVLGWWIAGPPKTAPAPAPVPAAPAAASVSGPRPPQWQELPTNDLPALVRTLRDAGFPPRLVRAIAAARLREQYAARRRALQRAADERFWIAPDNDAVAIQLQALRREEREALRQLASEDVSGEEQVLWLETRGLGFVPAERIPAVATVLQDFDEQRRRVFDAMGVNGAPVPFDPSVASRLDALEKAQHAELARVLTPEELERYELTGSRTATRLRSEMLAFQPTEEEYRSIFKLQQAFDDQWGVQMLPGVSETDRRARSEAQRQLREQIKLQLGPVRGADYERAADPGYRQTAQLVSRLQLPASTAVALYQVQKDIEAQMTLRTGSPEELQARLTQLEQDAVKRVGALIGEQNVDTYGRYGGMWLSRLRLNLGGSGAARSVDPGG